MHYQTCYQQGSEYCSAAILNAKNFYVEDKCLRSVNITKLTRNSCSDLLQEKKKELIENK